MWLRGEGDFPEGAGGFRFGRICVPKEYMKTSVEFNKGCIGGRGEGQGGRGGQTQGKMRRRPCRLWRDAKKADAAKKTAAATTKAEKTRRLLPPTAPKKEETKGQTPSPPSQPILGTAKDSTVAAPTTAKAPETVDSKGPGSLAEPPQRWLLLPVTQWWHTQNSSWANPYVYGGTSLTKWS